MFQPCGKELMCKKHKCARICHPSNCGLCEELMDVDCFCGKDKMKALCAQTVKKYSCKKVLNLLGIKLGLVPIDLTSFLCTSKTPAWLTDRASWAIKWTDLIAVCLRLFLCIYFFLPQALQNGGQSLRQKFFILKAAKNCKLFKAVRISGHSMVFWSVFDALWVCDVSA